MGSCFSKNTTATPQITHPQPQIKDQSIIKKEIFIIKHRISHEKTPNSINPNSTSQNPTTSENHGGARVRTASKEEEHEVDAILVQCGKLSRSNSTGAENPRNPSYRRRRRRYSGSKQSLDFDLNLNLKNDLEDDVDIDDETLDHRRRHRRQRSRVSTPSSRRSSRERRISISPSRRSESPFGSSVGGIGGNGGGSRRSESPFGSSAVGNGGGSSNKPVKMVPVPATDKTTTTVSGGEPAVVSGGVNRIHVKRNVGSTVSPQRSRSPARSRTSLRVFDEGNRRQESRRQDEIYSSDRNPVKRRSLAEIDNNAAARSIQPKVMEIVPKSIENLKIRETVFDPEPEPEPSPPSYASLLLEDIHNFHQKNSTATAPPPPGFSLPACVTKACSIMEAVADLNSASSSVFSEERWRNPSPIDRYNGGIMDQESSGSSGLTTRESPSREPNSVNPVTRVNPLGDFHSKLLDYPRKGIGRGRKSAESTPKFTTVT